MASRRPDLLHIPARRPRSKTPVLIVPGAFTGAWLWRDTLMPYMAARGFDAWAMNFSSHVQSAWLLHRRGLRDYVNDLQSATNRLPATPVLVANSLGAWVAYHFARQHPPRRLYLFRRFPRTGCCHCCYLFSRATR